VVAMGVRSEAAARDADGPGATASSAEDAQSDARICPRCGRTNPPWCRLCEACEAPFEASVRLPRRRPRIAALPARLRLVPTSWLIIAPSPAPSFDVSRGAEDSRPRPGRRLQRRPTSATPLEVKASPLEAATTPPQPTPTDPPATSPPPGAAPRRRTSRARQGLIAGLLTSTLAWVALTAYLMVERPSGGGVLDVPAQPVPRPAAPITPIAPTQVTAPTPVDAPAIAAAEPSRPADAAAPEKPARHHQIAQARGKSHRRADWRSARRPTLTHRPHRFDERPTLYPDDRSTSSLATEAPGAPRAFCGYPNVRRC
jgi:hypothetical protein